MNVYILANANMVYVGEYGISIDCTTLPANLKEVIWSTGVGGIALYSNHKADILQNLSAYQSYIDQFNHLFSKMTADQLMLCHRPDMQYHAMTELQNKIDFYTSEEAQEWAAAQPN
jgi:hypothetical protein